MSSFTNSPAAACVTMLLLLLVNGVMASNYHSDASSSSPYEQTMQRMMQHNNYYSSNNDNNDNNDNSKKALEQLAAAVTNNEMLSDMLLSLKQSQQQLSQELDLVNSNGTSPYISLCANDTAKMIEGIVARRGWALTALDATGKPPSGISTGALLWLGNYDQCMQAWHKSANAAADAVSTRYCTVAVGQPKKQSAVQSFLTSSLLRWGVCVPASCDSVEAAGLVRTLLQPVNDALANSNTSLIVVDAATECKVPRQELQWTFGAVAMLSFILLLIVIVLTATGYEYFTERSKQQQQQQQQHYSTNYNGNHHNHANNHSDKQILVNDIEANGDAVHSDADAAAVAANADVADTDVVRQPSLAIKLLLSFSLYSNVSKILDTSPAQSGTLSCVHGIRFISMTWVILGHTYFFGFSSLNNMGQLYKQWQNDWTFQAISSATISVDSFFVLSGLLSTYLFLREVDKRYAGQLKRINWVMFYVHRYWRLTPPYLLVMATYVTLGAYLYEGPQFPQGPGKLDPACASTWWRNALYVNNMVDGAGCMGWSWYLANDMQFYLISPLFLILLSIMPAVGIGLIAAVTLASMTLTGIHSSMNKLPAGFLGIGADFGESYIKPWYRIGAYTIGMLGGYLIHRLTLNGRLSRPRLNIPRFVSLAIWAVAAAVSLSVVYGLYNVTGGRVVLDQWAASLYNCVYRQLWSLALVWVIVACVTGHAGWVNKFLSLPVFAPLSRLTYCAYLVHPVVMETFYLSRRQGLEWDQYSFMHSFLSHCTLSYGVAFVVSMLYEAPLIRLEKVLRGA